MLLTRDNLPDTIADIAALDELLCRPIQALIEDLAKVDGDIMILGVAGKMGPTLAGLAKAARSSRWATGVVRVVVRHGPRRWSTTSRAGDEPRRDDSSRRGCRPLARATPTLSSGSHAEQR